MNLEEIREIAKKKDKTIKRIAQEIGMTEQNLHRCIRINSMKSKHLNKVAEFLEVPITVFLSDNVDLKEENTSKLKEPKTKYGVCTDCEQKDMIIKALTDRIKKLEKQLASSKRKK
ncbi:MAG: hypothetical protein LBQ60_04905 [Bacteroidales bacterium]|jgi:DNA-binding Xre family transcriptional regulator|nr:hypothetical protein [Bacteroidales bacterium]